MITRLAVTAVLVLTLVAGTSVASATSSGDYDWNSRSKRGASDDIWVGLCVGASLDLSRSSERSCQRKQRAAIEEERQQPAEPPNIGVGLCVGASLDLSRASAARCHQQQGTDLGAEPKPEHPHKKKRHTTTVTDENPAQAPFQYAALGDSVAAGAGLPGSSNPGDEVCDRSTEAYAYHIAAAHGFDFIHVACSGATMGDLVTQQRVRGTNPNAQLDSAFAAGTPQLITITAGANDVRWDAILLKCLRSVCGKTHDARAVEAALIALQVETKTVLQEIAQRSDGAPPKVILTGYYNPLPENCTSAEPRITSEEAAWVTSQLDSLNQTLADTTTGSSFATFVPIDFSGHDICSPEPWVQTTDDPSPLHPTAAGQQAIARMILANM